MDITTEVLGWAEILWDYHHLHNELQPADIILVLGSHDTRVADWAASLFLEGWAPLLMFSGGLGRLTSGVWQESEADKFARIATEQGVPCERILIENRSTNTGENIAFSRYLLQEKGLDPESFIVVQKPYMERRSYATFKKHWPDKDLLITSPQISFHDYATAEIPMEKVINIMVGDLQRIKLYPEKGFQVYQHIPAYVWEAFEKLVSSGYNKQLVQ
ncbi:YdcF family protein [Segetibacter sp. 3557_3]|uniref:YdcF family protein n=1 Tax=Segetibacter sp. 3557_3 TaxID=2547429 RepID=UPI001058F71D|nr:YdcF family protein [Segetibacter sp. 3557_3]TDH26058.1 YdcF family protein [Segetibacter sp. 3557_3]